MPCWSCLYSRRFLDDELRVIGREAFIAMKAYAGGPQGLSDASAVIAADRESLDRGLLQRLAGRFGRDTVRVVQQLLAAPE